MTEPAVEPVVSGVTSTKPPKKILTDYVVLAKQPDGDWKEIALPITGSAEQAIRAAAEVTQPDHSGTFVAIPVRSFKPVKVSTKTETRLVIEEAN